MEPEIYAVKEVVCSKAINVKFSFEAKTGAYLAENIIHCSKVILEFDFRGTIFIFK